MAPPVPSHHLDHTEGLSEIMRYGTLGSTGVQVSSLCLGAMMFGEWGNPDHDESIGIIRTALDAGVNIIDTADVYSGGESESISDLVRAGKIRYAGSSTFAASAIVQGQWIAERRQRERFVCEQPPYSLLGRGVEADVLPTCETYRMGVLAWSPLAGGWLSGRWHRDAGDLSSHRTRTMPFRQTSAHYDLDVPGNQAKLDAATELAGVADEAGLTLIQLALAFVTTHPAVSAAIIGPRTAEHLRDQLSAADIVLEPAVLDRIDRIVPPGTDLNPDDTGYSAAVLADPARRRRAVVQRTA
jgi:aryl-alcohol dehydrogenase-like predicted oxidoreductase